MLTLTEAGARLGLAPATLRGQIAKGKLRGRLVGKTWIVTEREVERYRVESLGRIGRTPRAYPFQPSTVDPQFCMHCGVRKDLHVPGEPLVQRRHR